MTDYKTLHQQLEALIHGVPHEIANLANAAALVYHGMENLNWAGFYRMEAGRLVRAPFRERWPALRSLWAGGSAARQWQRTEPSWWRTSTSSPGTSPVTALPGQKS